MDISGLLGKSSKDALLHVGHKLISWFFYETMRYKLTQGTNINLKGDLPHPGTEHTSHLHWQADAPLLSHLGNPEGFVYGAAYNAGASVLSPPTGQKSCKMASKHLTALACTDFPRIFGILVCKYLLQLVGYLLCLACRSGRSHTSCLFMKAHEGSIPSLPWAKTSILILPGFWLISSAICYCPRVHVNLYAGSLYFLHKEDDEVHHLNVFIRGISPHGCPETPWGVL